MLGPQFRLGSSSWKVARLQGRSTRSAHKLGSSAAPRCKPGCGPGRSRSPALRPGHGDTGQPRRAPPGKPGSAGRAQNWEGGGPVRVTGCGGLRSVHSRRRREDPLPGVSVPHCGRGPPCCQPAASGALLGGSQTTGCCAPDPPFCSSGGCSV